MISLSLRSPDQLGVFIKRYRKQKNLSQAELAEKSGLRQATISQIENGHGTTEIATIFTLLAALEVDLLAQPREKKNITDSYKGVF